MGNTTSRKATVTALKTPEKSSATTIVEHTPSSPSKDRADVGDESKTLAIPRTPAIPQTPLTETIANHLNLITADDNLNQQQAIKTPSYLLRKKILYDLGYRYSIKENDPRSPSQCIPRTPLNLDNNNSTVEVVNESNVSSFEYNSTLEDSCREFNTKLDEITMDEADLAKHDILHSKTNTKSHENDEESLEKLCDQKTPDAEFQNTPEFVQHTNDNCQKKTNEDDEMSNKVISKNQEENIGQNTSAASTPVMNKLHRTGRIPLSVINRRATGMSAEKTPLQAKNTSDRLLRTNLSFGSARSDENRDSARKSKIPVYKKTDLRSV